jgi:hypothetical protein
MPAAKMIRFHKEQDGWLQKQFFLHARSRQRPVNQIYLCGKVQSHRIVSRFTVFEPDSNLLSGVN